MPFDPTNVPLSRGTPSVAELTLPSGADAAEDLQLHPEPLLLEEFSHASVVAYQANGDRTNLLNLYLLLAGVIATAAGISASAAFAANTIGPLLAIIVGLVLAGILSFGFFMRLIALSDQYLEALLTMNVIKEVYIQELRGQTTVLERALRWRLTALPGGGKLRSSGATLFIGSIIAVVGSFYFAVATELLYHYTQGFGGAPMLSLYLGSVKISGLAVDGPIFLIVAAVHVLYYRFARGQRRVRASINAEAQRFGLSGAPAGGGV
jgi:hypothetical protein